MISFPYVLPFKKNLSTTIPWAFALVGALFAIRTVSDFDMGWHIAAGRWMWQHGRLVTEDTFSFTALGSPWVSIPWAYELILSALYAAGGVPPVVFFHALLTGVIALVAWKNVGQARRESTSADDVSAFLAVALLVATLFAVELRWNGRPEVFGQLWGTAMLFFLLRYRRAPGAPLWALPLVQIGWVNTHGTFIFGPFLVGLFLLASVVEGGLGKDLVKRTFEHPLFRALGVVLAACLVNPRGLTGALYPLHLLGVLHEPVYHQMNSEIRSPFADPQWGVDTWAMLTWLAVVAIIVVRNGARNVLRDYSLAFPVLVAVLTWGALAGRRNIALLILWTSPFVVDGAREVLLALYRRAAEATRESLARRARSATIAVFAVTVFLIVTNLQHSAESALRFGAEVTPIHRPERAVEFLKRHRVTGRSFADIEMANYLLWRYEGFPVYIDSRLAEVYTPARFQRYEDVLAHPRLFEEEDAQMRFELVVLQHATNAELVSSMMLYLAQHPSWQRVYLDEVAVIFAKKGSPALAALAPHASSDEATLRRLVEDDGARRSLLGALNLRRADAVKPFLHVADMFAAIGDPELADKAVAEALKRDRTFGPVWTTACRVGYLRIFGARDRAARATDKDLDETEEACRRATGYDDGPSYQALGLLYLNTGRLPQGIVALETATRRMPLSYPSFLVLGEARAALGDPAQMEGALAALHRAARLRPYEPEPLLKIAGLLEKLGRKDEAIGSLSRAQALRPDPRVEQAIARLRAR